MFDPKRTTRRRHRRAARHVTASSESALPSEASERAAGAVGERRGAPSIALAVPVPRLPVPAFALPPPLQQIGNTRFARLWLARASSRLTAVIRHTLLEVALWPSWHVARQATPSISIALRPLKHAAASRSNTGRCAAEAGIGGSQSRVGHSPHSSPSLTRILPPASPRHLLSTAGLTGARTDFSAPPLPHARAA
jgi:hypothetical protein